MDPNINSRGEKVDEDEIRRRCTKLLSLIQENREDLQDIDNEHLVDIMMQSKEIFTHVSKSTLMMLDAKIVLAICRIARAQADQMSANLISFKVEDFAVRLRSSMSGSGDTQMTRRKLIKLGRKLKPLLARSPCLSYLYGAVPVTEQETVIKKLQQRKVPISSGILNETHVVTGQVRSEMPTTHELVVRLLRKLLKNYRENQNKPVCYFRLIIHPTSFSETIENLFHASFLVKEGKAGMRCDPERGTPEIWPLRTGNGDSNGDNKQVVISMTVRQWQMLGKGQFHCEMLQYLAKFIELVFLALKGALDVQRSLYPSFCQSPLHYILKLF